MFLNVPGSMRRARGTTSRSLSAMPPRSSHDFEDNRIGNKAGWHIWDRYFMVVEIRT